MAKLGTPIKLPPLNFMGDWRNSAHVRAFDALEDEDDAARDRGEITGRLLKFPVADGYAVYRIVSVKPLTLAHIDYMDAWSIPGAHLRGITLASVKEELRVADARAVLLAKHRMSR